MPKIYPAAFLIVIGVTILAQQAPAPAPNRGGQSAAPPPSHSRIKTYDVTTKNVVEVYSSAGYFESPDFSADGKYIRFNGNDKLYQIPVTGGGAQAIGPADIVFNHDRGRSRDGKWQAAMNGPNGLVFNADWTHRSPVAGPLFIHAMSPDGEWLAGNCGGRVCRVARGGGQLEPLTSVGGNDNADFSPDGRWIYFDSRRSGKGEIWRIPAIGAGPEDSLAERITDDDGQHRFPHPSPDGKWIVLMSYPPGTVGRSSVPVSIRLIPTPGPNATPAKSAELLMLIGGQGTMHRNSWSPDSTKFAFASFE
jgi:TolB protein